MEYVVVVELRGFTKISGVLAFELEAIEVEATIIRTSIIKTVSMLISEIMTQNPDLTPDFQNILGGDTWGFVFSSFRQSIEFSCTLLKVLANNAFEKGLFHIKPSMAINCIQKTKIVDNKMIDDGFISAYRLADKGKSYTLFVGEELYEQSKKEIEDYTTYFVRDVVQREGNEQEGTSRLIFDWKRFNTKIETISLPSLSYLDILFDSNVVVLDTLEKTVANFMHSQNLHQNICICGGVIDSTVDVYRKYLKSIVHLFQHKNSKCTVLNYTKLSNKKSGYITVSIFYELMKRYPSKIAYGLQILQDDMLSPSPYHLYGKELAQFIMRSYSPHAETFSAISSFVIKSQRICDLYKNEFLENFKKAGRMTKKKYDQYVSRLELSSVERAEYDSIVLEYLKGTENHV